MIKLNIPLLSFFYLFCSSIHAQPILNNSVFPIIGDSLNTSLILKINYLMKQLALTTILFVFFALNGNTQTKKFSVGINLFPNFSAGIISNDGNTPGEVQASFDAIETWKPCLSSTFFVEYTINEKSMLGFGMGYQNNGEKTKKLQLIFAINPQTGQPIINPSDPSEAKFVYNRHNLELPIYYKRLFGKRFYMQAGVSGMFNLLNSSTTVKYYLDDSKERNTSFDNSTDYRRFNLAADLGCGWNYLTREKFTLYVQPSLQYGILGVSKSASLNRNFLSMGISTGIKF